MKKLALLAVLLGLLTAAYAQSDAHAPKDTRALRPPKGAAVALVVFEDMQCPDCARAFPLLQEAARTYNIPLVLYDFPLPQHNWSFEGAVMARYFDTVSQQAGNEFRAYLYANQPLITPQNLRQYAERFAAQKGVALPFVLDPRGELAKKVRADFKLGQATGIQHTPTIYVVSNTRRGAPFVEVLDRRQLFRMIEDMQRQAEPVKAAAAPAKPSSRKTKQQ